MHTHAHTLREIAEQSHPGETREALLSSAAEIDRQAARIRELEGALRDMLAHVATIRNNLPMRDTRENHEFIMESWSAARRILAEGSVSK